MRVALRRSDGHVGGSRDLFEREPERVLQNDDSGLFGRDLCQTTVQLAAQLRPVGLSHRIRIGRGPSILEQRLAGSSPLPVPHIATGVDRQPVQPGRELRLAPELLDLDAELRECFLRRGLFANLRAAAAR